MLIDTQVGPFQSSGGNSNRLRVGNQSDLITSDAHGRFHEATLRGNLYSDGMTLTSIANATFTTGTLGATATPILGVWNPLSNNKYLSILQARLSAILTALQATGAGSFMWCTQVGQAALTLGNTPLNRLTLTAAGSNAKGLAGVALTGLGTNLVVREASALQGGSNYNASLLATAVGFLPAPIASIENIDGAFIVPPGGILALLCTTTPVAVSAGSGLLWEEFSIT